MMSVLYQEQMAVTLEPVPKKSKDRNASQSYQLPFQ